MRDLDVACFVAPETLVARLLAHVLRPDEAFAVHGAEMYSRPPLPVWVMTHAEPSSTSSSTSSSRVNSEAWLAPEAWLTVQGARRELFLRRYSGLGAPLADMVALSGVGGEDDNEDWAAATDASAGASSPTGALPPAGLEALRLQVHFNISTGHSMTHATIVLSPPRADENLLQQQMSSGTDSPSQLSHPSSSSSPSPYPYSPSSSSVSPLLSPSTSDSLPALPPLPLPTTALSAPFRTGAVSVPVLPCAPLLHGLAEDVVDPVPRDEMGRIRRAVVAVAPISMANPVAAAVAVNPANPPSQNRPFRPHYTGGGAGLVPVPSAVVPPMTRALGLAAALSLTPTDFRAVFYVNAVGGLDVALCGAPVQADGSVIISAAGERNRAALTLQAAEETRVGAAAWLAATAVSAVATKLKDGNKLPGALRRPSVNSPTSTSPPLATGLSSIPSLVEKVAATGSWLTVVCSQEKAAWAIASLAGSQSTSPAPILAPESASTSTSTTTSMLSPINSQKAQHIPSVSPHFVFGVMAQRY